jgi:uncharacterized protein (TIGR00255 family)
VIRSMTGFGSATREDEGLRGAVTVRSLNHRFLDVALHLPRRLQSLESEARERVARAVGRGRVEVVVQVSASELSADAVVAVRPLVTSLVRTLRELQAELGLEGGVAVSDLVRFPGALERIEPAQAPPDKVREAVLALLGRALEELERMRLGEGERLRRELERVLVGVADAATRIEEDSLASRDVRQAALREKLQALVGELGLDEGRVYQETVRAVERHDVAEEAQRLRSHVASALELLAAEGEAAGKRLDFLAQELMREANTIGSKVQDAAVVRHVVELKAAIERFREQVQNVE